MAGPQISSAILSWRDVVHDYRRRWRRDVELESSWYGAKGLSATEAVRRACASMLPAPDGGLLRHPHQRRLSPTVLAASADVLLDRATTLVGLRSFEHLLDLVEEQLRPVRGAGELLAYDVAQRIGESSGVAPERIYLHAGTRKGASMLGLRWRERSIAVASVHPDLQVLSAAELEDVLCIYRSCFPALQADQRGARRPRGCAPIGSVPIGCGLNQGSGRSC